MDNTTAIQVLSGIITSRNQETDALSVALAVLQNGYAGEQTAIATAVAPLQATIDTLNAKLAAVEAALAPTQ